MNIKELIEEILRNFYKQQELYRQMADWSRQQLDLLEQEDWAGESLNLLLEQRQGIIAEIDVLSKQNRQSQQQVTSSLDLDEFVLSSLEKNLEAPQYQALQDALNALGNLLAEISEMDRQSNNLIRKKLGDRKSVGRRDSRLVQKAYKEAMQQVKKPE
ncbi:MAG: hypothetical protein CVU90_13340 [Firmicutes bacterium HGW-Firmicutes-15]|nr:MAG: hypothetical protein CVU90_13340 [Firmicutes bacterium HGW-Firmicutes-15]